MIAPPGPPRKSKVAQLQTVCRRQRRVMTSVAKELEFVLGDPAIQASRRSTGRIDALKLALGLLQSELKNSWPPKKEDET